VVETTNSLFATLNTRLKSGVNEIGKHESFRVFVLR